MCQLSLLCEDVEDKPKIFGNIGQFGLETMMIFLICPPILRKNQGMIERNGRNSGT